MHFGQKSHLYPALKVHNSEMVESDKQKFLGDLYTSDNRIDENILMKHHKGIGIANNIMTIVKHISYGFYSFEIALILRNSLLINGILYNVEALFTLNKKHIKQLEDCDKYLMQLLFNCSTSAPIEGYYIETSTWQIRHII